MAAPNQPGPVTDVMGPGLRSNPNVHRAPWGSLRVRIEAGQEWVVGKQAVEKRKGTKRRSNVLLGTNGNDRGRQSSEALRKACHTN